MDRDYIAFENEIVKELDIILNTYTIGEFKFTFKFAEYTNKDVYHEYKDNYDEFLKIYREDIVKSKEELCYYNELYNAKCIKYNDELYIDNILLKDILLVNNTNDINHINEKYFNDGKLMNGKEIYDIWRNKNNIQINYKSYLTCSKIFICVVNILGELGEFNYQKYIIKDYDNYMKDMKKKWFIRGFEDITSNMKDKNKIEKLEKEIKDLKTQNNRIMIFCGIILSVSVIKLFI